MSSPQPLPPRPDASTEPELLSRAAAGDAMAFELIMRRHNRLLYRTARSILRDDAESEDAVQDAWLKAWRALPTFRGESRLSTWLVRIAMNQALSRVRRRSGVVVPLGAPGVPSEEETSMQPDTPMHDPELTAQRAELTRIIERHIDRLPEQFRSVFMLRALEEMSVEEVAQALGIQEATVRTRFFRARAQLREALARDVDFAMDDAFSFDGPRCDRIVAGVMRAILTDPTQGDA
ncbi:RNA polymerase sigma factor [Ramlibacter henchirensis]|uniref:RNA polymerase sigma factor n=1 Tax=Ramlibacter henchirensis TaxID=204072 RepID=A0A4Z0C6K6_9BURK|nr:RNA polymerase sigma factor [Ramlibacter henchirensis]TFZ06110.1 RNA polymerase sigma factor [Ramlibacter henchirensis]